MKTSPRNRRRFLKDLAGSAALLSSLPADALASRSVREERAQQAPSTAKPMAPRLAFAVIGINHSHINSQVDAVIRGGGELTAVFAKEPDLLAAFSKRYPQAKAARSENEILDDRSVQLVLSSGIPDERAPLGIRVMQHGKDYMSDKPGITTLAQLAEVRRV
ncbi:MAG TPA: hypothetical protein VH458_01495, partial [Vicinamibacterales bacterium]